MASKSSSANAVWLYGRNAPLAVIAIESLASHGDPQLAVTAQRYLDEIERSRDETE